LVPKVLRTDGEFCYQGRDSEIANLAKTFKIVETY
jgi:hypothetical protein